MPIVSRREFFGTAAAGVALSAAAAAQPPAPAKPAATGLKSLTTDAKPITVAERQARLAKLQQLMAEQKIAAFLVEAGSSLEYFTGVKWWRSERTTAALIPAQGRTVVVTPYFEEPSIRETLQVDADVRSWKEDQSPFELIAGAMREHAPADGVLAIEPTTRYFIIERVGKLLGTGRSFVAGDALVGACRMHKTASELALMQAANNVTIAAIRYVHGHVEKGMKSSDILALLVDATTQLGGEHDGSLVLLNEASAFPHGSITPQSVRAGSTILIDSTCLVHGYQSDISRTWFYGEPSKRQREVWSTVQRGQQLALETAKIGIPVGTIDKTVRAFYESKGWSKDYQLPGLSHRTGHGIGMDVHESPYLVRSDTTLLEAGMCFSDEPGLYIPGEFGVRLEDCWHMTEQGPKTFSPLARSLEDPI
jgi:Xaa-Pro dipeptidase